MENRREKKGYLYRAMLDRRVVWGMIVTFFKVMGVIAVYFSGLVYLFSTQTMTGNQNIGEMTITALGEDFENHYAYHKSPYIQRATVLMLLMHIPLFWFVQPWAFQSLADVYFRDTQTL